MKKIKSDRDPFLGLLLAIGLACWTYLLLAAIPGCTKPHEVPGPPCSFEERVQAAFEADLVEWPYEIKGECLDIPSDYTFVDEYLAPGYLGLHDPQGRVIRITTEADDAGGVEVSNALHHELIHALLNCTTGEPDGSHLNPTYWQAAGGGDSVEARASIADECAARDL